MTRQRGTLIAALMLVLPMQLPSQEIPRLSAEMLTAFVARVGGISEARDLLLAKSTSPAQREAVADSLFAIANLMDSGPEAARLPTSDATAALLLATQSDVPEAAALGCNRLIRMALNGSSLVVRMNGVALLGMVDDHVKGASALKQVATSRSDVAPEAVRLLGMWCGPIGVSTVRERFNANSATHPEAAGWVGEFAKRYKWTRHEPLQQITATAQVTPCGSEFCRN